MIFKKRIKSHHFEKIIFALLILFGFAAIYVFIQGLKYQTIAQSTVVIMELNLIIIVILLAIALIDLKIYEKVE